MERRQLRRYSIKISVLLKNILVGALIPKKMVARMEKELLPWKTLYYAKKPNNNIGKSELGNII